MLLWCWPSTVKLAVSFAFFRTENEPMESRTIFLQHQQKKINKKQKVGNSSFVIFSLTIYCAIGLLCFLHIGIKFIAFVFLEIIVGYLQNV
jgi:hypothetical protein